ncbi:Plasma membrane fusion protein [Podosphaera aphanis]|nr:Plasma membrane fusion protein [Podosphaera aphanis]
MSHPNHGFPIIPSSLNARNHDLLYPHTLPSIIPYLGLRARLSQVWINRWTILLLLVLCRILLASKDLKYDVGRAKEEALEACSSVESVGSAMASMPHYLSTGVNALAADTMTKTIHGVMDMMLDGLDLVSGIILFIINMFTQTYACLITFAVTGSLSAAIELIEKVGKFMNESIGHITSTLEHDTKSFQDGINSILKKIQIPPFFGGSKSIPQINLSGPIEALHNIKIDPTKMNEELNKLNASLPNFADVQKLTEDVIKFPFNELAKLMNETRDSYTFNHTVFPVAQKKKLTFCSDNNTIQNFFDDLVTVIWKASIIFTILLFVLAILFGVATAFKEIRAWRKQQNQVNFLSIHAYDRLDYIYIASRPHTATIGIHMASKFFKSLKRRNLARWYVAYGTSLPALYVLSLGFAGLFSCLCQYILLTIVEKEVPKFADEIGDFSEMVYKSLDDASKEWAVNANDVIHSVNSKVNNDVLGWVQTGTGAVNNTIDKFTGEMTKVLNATFGGTVLYHPVLEVMNCLVGLKIASVQKGLTWVHDKAHVSLPEFKPEVFSLGAAASLAAPGPSESFLASPGSVTSDKITSAVTKVVTKLQDSIKEEAMISAVLILLWIFLLLVGLGRVILADLTREKPHGEGGPPGYSSDAQGIPLTVRGVDGTHRFPQFRAPASSIYPADSFGNKWECEKEVYGQISGHQGVTTRVGDVRSSSHGYVTGTKI